MKYITNIYQVSQYSRLGPLFLGRMNHCPAGSPPCSPLLKEAWLLGWIMEIQSENHHRLAGGAVVRGSDVWTALLALYAGYRKVSASAWVVEQVFRLVPPRKTCCLVAACGKYLQNAPAALVGEQTAQRRGEIPVGFMAFWRVWRGMAAVPPPEGEMQQKSNLFLPTGNLYGGSVLQTVSVGTHTCTCRCHQPYSVGVCPLSPCVGTVFLLSSASTVWLGRALKIIQF